MALERLFAAVVADASDHRSSPSSARTLLVRDLENGVAVEHSSIDDWTFSRLDLDTT